MVKKVSTKNTDFDVQIGIENGSDWNQGKIASVQELIRSGNAQRSKKARLRTELLSIQYQMEDYVEKSDLRGNDLKSLETFVKSFLHVLNITFKKFAETIDTSDGNLKKYISGERKFNSNLALKFGYFFHTSADLWMKVQMKNELHALQREKTKITTYRKYDYEKIID
jgi:plasmid maintenance system antidote protein VapI